MRAIDTRRMMLEVIRKTPRDVTGKPPLLLMHGAWHGAWCWDRGFMDRLVAHGHETVAVSLRGHGGSEGHGWLARRTHGLADYVDDVARVADGFESDPVVVGHSLGGFVVQRYLSERRRARAGVLMAPIPPTGVFPLFLRLMRSDPIAVARVLMTMSCRPVVGDAGRAARLFFTGATTRAEVDRLFPHMGDESFRVFLELLHPTLDPSRVEVPLAVLAASADAVFSMRETEATARAYGIAPVVFAGMGHDMMLDPAWPTVADWIVAWCAALLPPAADVGDDGSIVGRRRSEDTLRGGRAGRTEGEDAVMGRRVRRNPA